MVLKYFPRKTKSLLAETLSRSGTPRSKTLPSIASSLAQITACSRRSHIEELPIIYTYNVYLSNIVRQVS